MAQRTISPKLAALALEAKRQHGTWRKAGAALGVPYATLYHIAHGNAGDVSAASERRLGRALGLIDPPRKVRRVTVQSIPAQRIRALAEQGEDAAVLRWLERIGA